MSNRNTILWRAVLAACVVGQATAAVTAAPLPKAKVEQAVINALPGWHGKKVQIIDYLDLTRPFATAIPWALVVARNPGPQPAEWTHHGPIAVCLVGGLVPHCAEAYWQTSGEDTGWFARPYQLVAGRVVYAGGGEARPLLLVQTCSIPGINGNCSVRTALYRYVQNVGQFRRVFVHDSGGRNNNQDARFVEKGPLHGDVIVDYPTGHAPYPYWIEVYAPRASEEYAQILRYRGRTRYGDHNPLAVADSEMPEILKRLGFWKPGDALPVPSRKPEGCNQLVLRDGEEWCKQFQKGTKQRSRRSAFQRAQKSSPPRRDVMR